ncbi:hypothetical protein Avbf_04490 [Armadillidium vulgare]|nr:hypothetical protein Avbf_04490 [Armadillidium vulgare]
MLREAKLEYIGAHPDEDVDKILAEATNQLCSKEDTSDNEAIATPTIDTEGAEPMDEGGAAIEAETTSQAPQNEMTADSVTENTEPQPELGTESESNFSFKPDSESKAKLKADS